MWDMKTNAYKGTIRKNGEVRILKNKSNYAQEVTQYDVRSMYSCYINNLVEKLVRRYIDSLNYKSIKAYKETKAIDKDNPALDLKNCYHYFIFNDIGFEFSLVQDKDFQDDDARQGKWRIHLCIKTFQSDSLSLMQSIDNITSVDTGSIVYTDELDIQGEIILEMVYSPYGHLYIKHHYDEPSIRKVYNSIIDLWINCAR